ncbi:MAG: hypothetical protein MH137_02335 [Flavobacteriales bacterium]|nr:hypothetical protein [Flavobacteriales bacterium]
MKKKIEQFSLLTKGNKTVEKFFFSLFVLTFLLPFSSFAQKAQGEPGKSTYTRAEISALDQKEAVMLLGKDLKIRDLVQDQKSGDNGTAFYLSEADFYNATPEKKLHILSNSDKYVIYSGNTKPRETITISKEEFLSLPEHKRNALKEQGNLIIK